MCALPAILKSSATFFVSPTGIGGVSISSLEEPLRGWKLKVWSVTPSDIFGTAPKLPATPQLCGCCATVPAHTIALGGSGGGGGGGTQ